MAPPLPVPPQPPPVVRQPGKQCLIPDYPPSIYYVYSPNTINTTKNTKNTKKI